MSLEADILRDTNPTPTRFLLECEEMTPMFSFNLDNPYSPFDASYKFLNPGTPRSETDLPDTDLKPSSSASMLAQQQAFPPPGQHPWSNMVFGEACMPMRQLSPRISPRSSISSNSSCSSSTSPLQSPISSSFRSRTSSMASDQLISHLEATGISTHESNTIFELVPSNKLYHSDQDLPSLEPDSLPSDTLVPSDAFSHPSVMGKDLRAKFIQTTAESREMDHDDQDMSDHHDSVMDVDLNESNESNDDDDEEEEEEEMGSARSTRASRESPSLSEYAPTRGPQTRASRRAATLSTKAPQPVPKSSSRAKRSSTMGAKNSTPTTSSATTSSRKSKTTSTKSPSRASSAVSKGSGGSRKHPSSDEESPEAKRQRFLERNRMAASKCREKKRLQTLKTIADADVITARNQALHESLDELQEEVRALKNQILCHRDCGCDVIRKFVQSSYGSTSCLAGSIHLGTASTRSQPQLC